jgi:hypothetical protein
VGATIHPNRRLAYRIMRGKITVAQIEANDHSAY